MIAVFSNSWTLFVGILLLMIGNGLQGTVVGLRGALEGFSATEMSYVMSGYFLGFLGGARLAPRMIGQVGHVRVFAALASLISAAFILYAAVPDVMVWTVLRVLIGFCFSGVYVVAESWINEASTNENRGQTLSLYLIVQMLGVTSAQFMINFANPGGWNLFVLMSVLVSVSFAPILLSAQRTPPFETTKPMTIRAIFAHSPLSCMGMLFLGGIFATLFGMSPVYATEVGLSVQETTIFISMIFIGGMVVQYPVGWLSDRMDRRLLIMASTAFGAGSLLLSLNFTNELYVVYALGFVSGGIANPLYSLLLAYANDSLEHDDMAAASGGMIFINGLGAIMGPVIVGVSMEQFGPNAFFILVAVLMAIISAYSGYRMTRRPAIPVEETSSYPVILPTASPVMVEIAQEVAIEMDIEEQKEADEP